MTQNLPPPVTLADRKMSVPFSPAAGAPVCMQPACKPTVRSSNRKHVPDILQTGDHNHQLVVHLSGSLSLIVCLVQASMAVPETRDGFEQNAASASLAHLRRGVTP